MQQQSATRHTACAVETLQSHIREYCDELQQLNSTIQTKDVLQTVTMLQDKIPAHPTQQTLYATTVED